MTGVSIATRWFRKQPKLADLCEGRDNNLNLLRMVLAGLVLVSHAWIIARGPTQLQPLEGVFGFTMGTLCVYGFFFISGFLVTQSLMRRHDLWAFAVARGLRIFPGLGVALIVTALVLGPVVTTLAAGRYLTSPGTWLFIVRNFTLVSTQRGLPGVFETTPYNLAINGSLWTLFYEVACYCGLGLIGAAGLFKRRNSTLGLFAGLAALLLLGDIFKSHIPPRWANFENLVPFFALGMAAYFVRGRLPLNRVLAAIMLAVCAAVAVRFTVLPPFLLAFCYALLSFGYIPGRRFAGYNRLGDYSYGTYIYAFPVQMTFIYASGGMSPLELTATAFPATLLIAVLSWHFVEQPALALKKYLHGRNRALPLAMEPRVSDGV